MDFFSRFSSLCTLQYISNKVTSKEEDEERALDESIRVVSRVLRKKVNVHTSFSQCRKFGRDVSESADTDRDIVIMWWYSGDTDISFFGAQCKGLLC